LPVLIHRGEDSRLSFIGSGFNDLEVWAKFNVVRSMGWPVARRWRWLVDRRIRAASV
jgi:hypothetical protein